MRKLKSFKMGDKIDKSKAYIKNDTDFIAYEINRSEEINNVVILQVLIKTKNRRKFRYELRNGIIQNTIEIKSNSDGKGIIMFIIKCNNKYQKEITDLGFKHFRNNKEEKK